jgi:ER-bound oxygenase mpaB/B'/Rubber oxygenase, catalytic domain
LLFYSLPFDYLDHKGAQVLALTTRMVSNPARRTTEVLQFLMDIMQHGGLTASEGRGRRSIQKVRLMHASVRRLAAGSPSWKQEWNLPVNQEDLLLTLTSFSWVVLDGLEKLGVTISQADQEAYLHCWLVVGHMLGIRDNLLPSDVASARKLAETIAGRQFGPSPEGKALTKALQDLISSTLPGDMFRHVAPIFIRYFVGDERAEWLGIEDHGAEVLMRPLQFLGIEANHLIERSHALSRLAEKLSPIMLQAFLLVDRGGNRPTFSIPTELREQWGANWLS